MHRSDWFASIVAVFILGAGAVLSTFSTEIVRLAGMALMAAAILGLIIWFAWGRTSQATWTADGKVSGGKTRVALGIVLLCVLIGGGSVASHWPLNFLMSSSGAPTPPEFTGPITSRLNHFILSCDVPPPPPGKSVTGSLWELQDYKRKLDVLGDAMGVTFTMETIRGGVRIELEATTDEAKQRILSLSSIGVTKFTFEIRRVEKVELISLIVKLPPQFAFYGWIPPNPAASDTKQVISFVEHFFGFKPGICQLV